MKSWPKVKLGQVQVGSNIAQNHSSTVQITFIFIDFSRLRLKRKTHPAFRVLNVFYFQADFNLRLNANETFVWLLDAFDASYIAYYSLNWLCPLHRIISLKWIWPAFSETKTETETKPTQRSQITDQNLRKEANAKCAVSVHVKRV